MKIFLKVLLSLTCAEIYCCEGHVIAQGQLQENQQKLTETRIIGGSDVVAGFVPYQVSIQNTFGEHVCGGAIIDSEWIITAAHCMDWPKQFLKVVTGTVNWTKPDAEYTVEDVKIHCLYNKPVYHNDIALIRLSTPILYNERTLPIKMADRNNLKEGEKLTLSGWGSTKLWGRNSDILKEVQVPYMEYDKCYLNVKKSVWLGKGHICTDTTAGKGSCNGDSGGPLVDRNNVLVGIVNWGEPCAIGRPDVFASVAYYHDWIEANLAGNSTC